MLVTLLPIVTEVKLLQSMKAYSPMLVTLLGIVTEVKLLQPSKAPHPMLVTLLGIVTEVRLLQYEKALFPMLVTLLPIVTEVKSLQSQKARSPMLVTPSLIITDVIDELLEYHGADDEYEYCVIAPVPLMVSTPSSERVHVRFSPQVPLLSAKRVPTLATMASKNVKSFFLIIKYTCSCRAQLLCLQAGG